MLKFRLLITAFLVIFPMIVAAQATNPEALPVYSVAREVLSDLLNDPVIQYAFSDVQGTLLRTNSDLITAAFFDSEPLFVAMRPLFRKQLDKEVRAAIQEGTITMTRITRGANYLHNDILDVIEASLRSAGRSEDSIKTVKVYITDGPMNAYTVSGKNGEQVIVIDTGLIDKLVYSEVFLGPKGQQLIRPRLRSLDVVFNENGSVKDVAQPQNELKPVLEHEGGHKLSGHIDVGIELSAMVRILFNYYVSQGESFDLDDEGDLSMLPDHHYRNNRSVFSTFYRNSHTKAVKFVQKTITDVATQQRALDTLRSDFVEHLIRIVLQDGEMTEDVMRFLVTLRTAGPNLISKDAFLANMGPIMKMIGRQQETSADQFAQNGTNREFINTLFVKFNGSMQVTNPNDRDKYIAEILEGNKKLIDANFRFYDDSTPEERQDLLGKSGGDHPTNPTRAENVKRYGRTLDAEAMQNPILRLVVLHSALKKMGETALRDRFIIEKSYNKLQSKGKEDEVTNSILANLWSMYEAKLTLEKTSHLKAEIVLKKLTGLIKTVGFKGNTFSANYPLTDIIDFVLGMKIRTRLSLKDIAAKLRSLEKGPDKAALQEKYDEYQKQFEANDDVLKALRTAVHSGRQESNIFTPQINLALESRLTVAKARNLRRAIAKGLDLDDEWYRHWFYTKVGDEALSIEGASVKGDQESMRQSLIQRHAALDKINRQIIPAETHAFSGEYITPNTLLPPDLRSCVVKTKLARSLR